MGNESSKPKSVFNLQRPHQSRIRRATHASSLAPTSGSCFSDDDNYADFHTDNKYPPSLSPTTVARCFLAGRKRSKSNALFVPDEFPSEQRSFWKDFEPEGLRRPSNTSLALGRIVPDIVKAAFNGILHMSPVIEILSAGGSVLDLGCGSAKWSFEMCTTYPNSHITGLDMSSTLIKDSPPKNFKLQKGNSLTRLPFSDDTFDLVYSHGILTNTRKEHNDTIISEIIRITKPGGYFELVENDVRAHNAGPALQSITNQTVKHIFLSSDPESLSNLSAKFSSHPALLFVQTEYKSLRIGPYDGWALSITRDMLRSLEGFAAKGLGLEKSEYLEYVEKCLEECCEFGTCHMVWVTWGQKSRL